MNGREKFVSPTKLEHKDIIAGGLLEFEMVAKPELPPELPPDLPSFKTSALGYVAVPVINGPGLISKSNAQVSLESITPDAKLFYTLDGSEPTKSSAEYKAPFSIYGTSIVKAIAVTKLGQSLAAEARFIKKPNDWTVTIASKYNRQYTGGGDDGLIDGIRGTTNFASGEWQGYQGQDFVATIDLQKEMSVSKLGGGFLQNARSWIWMPTHIEFETSLDGVNFTKIADIKTDIDTQDMEPKIRDYTQNIAPIRARYIRVHAYNLGKIPSWHPGAGDDAFIFVDELFVQ